MLGIGPSKYLDCRLVGSSIAKASAAMLSGVGRDAGCQRSIVGRMDDELGDEHPIQE